MTTGEVSASAPATEGRKARTIPASRGGSAMKRQENVAAYVFLGPWLVGILGITLLPILASLYLSFTNYGILNPPAWIGREAFRRDAFAHHHNLDGFTDRALDWLGEDDELSLEQRKAALDAIAELAAPLPVIANVSDIRPGVVAELARFASRLGLPGIGIMPPSFYSVSDADQLAFFLHAADAAQLPVMLYNFPELTGNRIAMDTIAAFGDRAPMVAIKQSGREFEYHNELIALAQPALESGEPVRAQDVALAENEAQILKVIEARRKLAEAPASTGGGFTPGAYSPPPAAAPGSDCPGWRDSDPGRPDR